MITKRYINWSKENINLQDPFMRKWYIKQVLTYGRAEDISLLDWNEIEKLLPELDLPVHIKRLWENYFDYKRQRNNNR